RDPPPFPARRSSDLFRRRASFHFSRRRSLTRRTAACSSSSRLLYPILVFTYFDSGVRPCTRRLRSFRARDSSSVTTMPPSPYPPRFLVGKKEKQAACPREPTFLPRYSAPIAWQASSMTHRPCSRAIAVTSSISAG